MSIYTKILMIVSIAGIVGCSSFGGSGATARRETTSSEYFEIAKKYMDAKNYTNAIAEFKILIRRYPEAEITDDALLELVKAYYFTEDYEQAIYEIRRLVRDYAESPLIEDAQYYLGKCYVDKSSDPVLDQQDTQLAVDELNMYKSAYEKGKYAAEVDSLYSYCREKLAEKVYLTAELYQRQKEYAAGIIYCNQLIEEFKDTSWHAKAFELLGVCEIKLKDIR